MGLWAETAGSVVGKLWGPPFRAIAEVRHARSLHAEGICLQAEVIPVRTDTPFTGVAERLAGPAIVRMSTALWRGGKEWPDILGAAVRFRRAERPCEEASPGDQDLLFSTMRHMWTMAPAAFTTHVHDWLDNDYFGIAPFEIRGLGRAKLRLTALAERPERQGSRVCRLEEAIQEGRARFTLELRSLEPSLPQTWTPLVELLLHEEITLDPEQLRFNPFRDGRGIRPVGFLHAMRRSAYRQSQVGRTEH